MNYQVKPGDTLLNIAANLTLSGAYAPALATLNGLEDRDVTEDLTLEGYNGAPAISSLTIPDNWLRTYQTTGGGNQTGQPRSVPTWAIAAAIVAIALLG